MSSQTDTIRIAYQGVPGAFSHRAGYLFAKAAKVEESPEFLACETFAEVFDRVLSGAASHGVLPLENSTIGSIVANYDLLWAHEAYIAGEVSMPIHHQLLGIEGAAVEEIREVYSHPAALDQCSKFFATARHLRAVAHFDTSGAARHVSALKNPAYAAIAGEFAASEYGLHVLKSNIEDYPYNRTRFGVITRPPAAGCDGAPPQAPYKISCAVELPHTPGSLALLLTRIAGLDINLTKIESRPIPEAPWHYRFFIDMELDGQDQDDSVVKVLKDTTETYRLLGRYKPWKEPS